MAEKDSLIDDISMMCEVRILGLVPSFRIDSLIRFFLNVVNPDADLVPFVKADF